jgi:ribonuclease HI
VLKVNSDGAYYQETGTGGWGFAIRDNTGSVRGTGAGFLAQAGSAAFVEAQACQEALYAAANWGMGKLHIESDAMNLIKAMQDNELDRTPEGVIYRDIRAFIRLNFISVSFSHCPRVCNKLAHELATVGVRRHDVRSLWLESWPDDVNVLVVSMLAESVK